MYWSDRESKKNHCPLSGYFFSNWLHFISIIHYDFLNSFCIKVKIIKVLSGLYRQWILLYEEVILISPAHQFVMLLTWSVLYLCYKVQIFLILICFISNSHVKVCVFRKDDCSLTLFLKKSLWDLTKLSLWWIITILWLQLESSHDPTLKEK